MQALRLVPLLCFLGPWLGFSDTFAATAENKHPRSLLNLLKGFQKIQRSYPHSQDRPKRLARFQSYLSSLDSTISNTPPSTQPSIDEALWQSVFEPMSKFVFQLRERHFGNIPSQLPDLTHSYFDIVSIHFLLDAMQHRLEDSGLTVPEGFLESILSLQRKLGVVTLVPPSDQEQVDAVFSTHGKVTRKWKKLNATLQRTYANTSGAPPTDRKAMENLSKQIKAIQKLDLQLSHHNLEKLWMDVMLDALYVEIERAANDVTRLEKALRSALANASEKPRSKTFPMVEMAFVLPQTEDVATETLLEHLGAIAYQWPSMSQSPTLRWWKARFKAFGDEHPEGHVYTRREVVAFVKDTLARLPAHEELEQAFAKGTGTLRDRTNQE